MDKKIIILEEDLGQYSMKDFAGIPFDVLVYYYRNEGYEGSGFATWRVGADWYYDTLSHCSCNGPTENVNISANAKFTLEQIKVIAKNQDYNGGPQVEKYLTENNYV